MFFVPLAKNPLLHSRLQGHTKMFYLRYTKAKIWLQTYCTVHFYVVKMCFLASVPTKIELRVHIGNILYMRKQVPTKNCVHSLFTS